MLTYHCANCGHEREVPDDYAGRTAKCPKCRASNRIVSPAPVAATGVAAPPSDQSADDMVHAAQVDEAANPPAVESSAPPAVPPVVAARRQPNGLSLWPAIIANVLLLAILASITAIGARLWNVADINAQLSALDDRLSTADGKLETLSDVLTQVDDRLAAQFAPRTWEYAVQAPSDASFQASIDQIGDKGWELVAARRATREVAPLLPWNDSRTEASYEMIFKRPKR